MPKYYALGRGRYWLKNISNLMENAASAGYVGLALPVCKGSFRLLMTLNGNSLLLQQQRAAGPWQTQLHLALRPLANSLARHYGQHVKDINLPAPVEVRARAGRLQLRLFVSSLNQRALNHRMQYAYTAEGLLEIKP